LNTQLVPVGVLEGALAVPPALVPGAGVPVAVAVAVAVAVVKWQWLGGSG
jgi:hypothetical protein